MRLLIDFFPVLAFFIAYYIPDDPAQRMYVATAVAIVAVIVGGRSSFAGPVIGAIIVMILRAEVTWLLAARWQDAATFALLAIVLYVRPMGLMGIRNRVEEAG